ncbi:MAG: GSCFA domain-containing protein [Bacteroidia bacterium]|nr:GSCFA domain-containing protein [Bacteroidia bacterium]
MKLQTQIPIRKESNQIDYDSRVLLLGSCFTENIGAKLDYYKFQNLQNPFGILFHPKPIERLIRRAVKLVQFVESDIFEQDGQWRCMEVHSLVSHPDKITYLKLLNEKLAEFTEYLKNATHVIITFGSAWGYRYHKTNEIAGNCHKIPQKEFRKEIASVQDVSECMNNIAEAIHGLNPSASLIYTVSPVRHLKDGFIENTRSKSHLIAGIHALTDRDTAISYFPSYEMMMDEMRDYRFYTEDMLHPNKTAVEIIWDRFEGVWIDPQTEPLRKEIASIQSGLAHKPFNPNSESYREFQLDLQQKISRIQDVLPHLEF